MVRTPCYDRTVTVVGTGITLSILLAGFVALIEPYNPRVILSGILAWVAGWGLRQHCFRQLGRAAFVPELIKPARVVRTGLYRWLAHPSYIGAVLECYGVGCLFGSTLAALVCACGAMVVYAYRADVEDVLLQGVA